MTRPDYLSLSYECGGWPRSSNPVLKGAWIGMAQEVFRITDRQTHLAIPSDGIAPVTIALLP